MNKTQITIIVVLLLCLIGLGGMFLINSQKLDDLKSMQEQQSLKEQFAKQEKELAELRKKNTSLFEETAAAKAVTPTPAPSSNTPSVDPAKLRETEADRLKDLKALEAEEKDLFATKDAENNNKALKDVNQVSDARLVGKVVFYDRGNNLLIFQPVGQPSLKNGDEVAIRRRGAIYVTVTIEELDPQTGNYSAEVKRNELYDADKDDSVIVGDEIIITPKTLEIDLPDLNTNPLNTKLPPIPMEPDFAPAS